MSSTTESSTREGSDDSSRYARLRTIWVRIYIYVLDGAYPRVKGLRLPVHQSFRLRDSIWFQWAIPGDYRCELFIWRRKYEDWSTVNRDEATIWVTERTSTFILRLPHVRLCLGLGRELQLREQHRLAYFGGVPVSHREVCDIRVPRTDKIGDDFTVVVYPAILEAPQVFIIRLNRNGQVAFWDYPALAQACFGCKSRKDAVDGIRVWNPEYIRFDYRKARTPVYAVEGYDFIIVRNEFNRYTPGLGIYIEQLERQTQHRVQPSNIPFDDPTHTSVARPALSIRVKRDPSPNVASNYEAMDSDYKASDSGDHSDPASNEGEVMEEDARVSDEEGAEGMEV